MDLLQQRLPSEGFLRSVLDATADCIKVVGPDGALQYMSANGLCAMEIDDFSCVQGLQWASLWPGETAGLVRQALAAAFSGRTTRFEAFCPSAKGTPKWWEVTVSPIRDAAGEVSSVLSVSREVTERKRADEALKESEARFRNLAD